MLAAPYHRNTYGNVAAIRFFDAGAEEARGIVEAAGARYVVLCLSSPEVVESAARQPDGVAARVLDGAPPDWLRALGPQDGPVRVYALAPSGTGAAGPPP